MRKMKEKILLSGAWPKSKAAPFEFSEVCQGFTIINSHIAPGNGPLSYMGGEQYLLAPCFSAAGLTVCKGQPQARRAPTAVCLVARPELSEMGQPVWSCATEPDLEAACLLGRLACVSANSWTLGGTTRLCMKSFLGFTLG